MMKESEDCRQTRSSEKYLAGQKLDLQADCWTMSSIKRHILVTPQPSDILFMRAQYQPEVYIDKSEPLGKGSYNTVYPAFIRNSQNQLQPAVIKEAKYTKKQWSLSFCTSYQCQVQALYLLSSCPSTVKLYGAFYVGGADRRLCLLLERCVMSLEDCLERVRNSTSLALQVFQKLIGYLTYAHNLNQFNHQKLQGSGAYFDKLVELKKRFGCVVHKDLKPANILVRKLEGQSIDIAVADFGMAALCESYSCTFSNLYGGTVRYESPEMQMNKEYDSKIDCWSFAILIRSLFCKHIKFEAMNYAFRMQSMKSIASKVEEDMKQAQFPDKQVVVYILQHCLQFERNRRWFSHSIKAVWDHRDKLHLIKSQKLSTHARESFHDLIAVQVTLLVKINQQVNKLQRRCLNKITDYNQRLISYLVEQNPMILPELQLKYLRVILDQKVVEGWEKKVADGCLQLLVLERKEKQQFMAPFQKEALSKHFKILIGNFSFSQNEKVRMDRFMEIFNQTV